MPVRLLGVLWYTKIGTPAELVFRPVCPLQAADARHLPLAGRLRPMSGVPMLHCSFQDAIALAFRHTAQGFGWPAQVSFEWGVGEVDPALPLPPALAGGSMFGAFALGLIQSIVFAEPECVRRVVVPLKPCMRGTSLHKIAVTAACDDTTGLFAPVEYIVEKLERLSLLSTERLSRCVIAQGQVIPPEYTSPRSPDTFLPHNGGREFPLVRAYDSTDAFFKLFSLQAHEAVGEL